MRQWIKFCYDTAFFDEDIIVKVAEEKNAHYFAPAFYVDNWTDKKYEGGTYGIFLN